MNRQEAYREARMEHEWYREQLLKMVEEEEQGSDTWDMYREEMKKTGKQVMKLSRRLPDSTDGSDGETDA